MFNIEDTIEIKCSLNLLARDLALSSKQDQFERTVGIGRNVGRNKENIPLQNCQCDFKWLIDNLDDNKYPTIRTPL